MLNNQNFNFVIIAFKIMFTSIILNLVKCDIESSTLSKFSDIQNQNIHNINERVDNNNNYDDYSESDGNKYLVENESENVSEFPENGIKSKQSLNYLNYHTINIRNHRSDVSSDKLDDEISESCGGTFRDRQKIIESPNYPNNYLPNLKCHYIFYSPYVCKNEFHIQFLDFALETSPGCPKDRLKIGDAEILCGKVIGIMKYKSNNGVLRITFSTDDANEATGFKLLVTRLPCIDGGESTTPQPGLYQTDNEPSWNGEAPTSELLPPNNNRDPWKKENQSGFPVNNNPSFSPDPNCQHNFGFNTPAYPNYQPYPTPNFPYPTPNIPQHIPNSPFYPTAGSYPGSFPSNNYPTNGFYPHIDNNPVYNTGMLPVPSYPSQTPSQPEIPTTNSIPYNPNTHQNCQPYYHSNPLFNTFNRYQASTDQNLPQKPIQFNLPRCCLNTFSQTRFFLVSPGFPSTRALGSDCNYIIERSHPGVCRVIIDFKFFLLGRQNGNHFGCLDGYLEIDGQRICGCNTGLRYISQWGLGPKIIRFVSTPSVTPTVQGFVLDVTQEPCPMRIGDENQLNWKRADYPIYQTVTIQTQNSTTTTLFQRNPSEKSEQREGHILPSNKASDVQDGLNAEKPSSRFVYGATFYDPNRCLFSYTNWIGLAANQLFLSKPVCVRG